MKRLIGLDIMRSVAILLVLATHTSYLMSPAAVDKYYRFVPAIDGVSIFFVLSGFLIRGILLRTIETTDFGWKALLNFWIRRWLRTAPAYFVVLLLLIGYDSMAHVGTGLINKIQFFFFSQNLFHKQFPFFFESWSITVEEWFYLLFPFICFLLHKILRDKMRTILFVALIFMIVPFLLRVIFYNQGMGLDNYDSNYRKVVMFRLDSIMYGVVGAVAAREYNDQWSKYKYGLFAVAFALIVFLSWHKATGSTDRFNILWSFNLEAIASLFMLPFLSELKGISSTILFKVFTFISVISYSIYLVNYSLVYDRLMPLTLSNLGYIPSIIRIAVFFTYTFLLSYLLNILIEKPFMRLREKINI